MARHSLARRRELSARLLNEGVDTAWVDVIEEVETGVAAITVAGGDNAIVVIPGANHRLSEAHVQAAERVIRDADVVVEGDAVRVTEPGAVARIAKAPFWFTVPATTSLRFVLETGIGSPVIMDSST